MIQIKKINAIFVFVGMVICFYACNTKPPTKTDETNTSGSSTLLVDESVAPIVEEELMVFHSDYPKAHLKTVFFNEAALIDTLMKDSTKNAAIIARTLTKEEKAFFIAKRKVVQERRFAIDGIALVANDQSKIASLSVKEIAAVLAGRSNDFSLVFNHPGASTLQHLKSTMGITEIAKKGVFVLNSTEEVLAYVQKNNNFVGVVGLNWLLNNDTSGYSLPKNVKIIPISDTSQEACLPSQENLMSGKYPLRRELFILNLRVGYGLGIGFASWLQSDRGQLIVLKSGLAPSVEPHREIRIIKKLNIK